MLSEVEKREKVLSSGSGKGKERQKSEAPGGALPLPKAVNGDHESSSGFDSSIDGEHGFVEPISDEELRRMSSTL